MLHCVFAQTKTLLAVRYLVRDEVNLERAEVYLVRDEVHLTATEV